jgi:sulfite reductase beta subunit-like hemoprotein
VILKRKLPEIKPNLHTKFEDFSQTEKAKLAANGLRSVIRDINSPANLSYQLRDQSFEDLSEVAETLAKSYGIYLEFNRAKTGSEKDWMYMLRITIPGGGPLTPKQWLILDEVATKYTVSDSYTGMMQSSLRITSRQNIQLHWVKKKDVVNAVQEIARSGFYTINGCGDNVRNTVGCPLSRYSSIFDANAWAQKVGKYFRLPTSNYIEVFAIDPSYLRPSNEETLGFGSGFSDDGEDELQGSCARFNYGPNLLNRKFKIAFSSVHLLSENDRGGRKYLADNCVEMRTNDIGVAPIIEASGKVVKFQVYIGGSQGEKAGHPTFAALGEPFGIFYEKDLLKGLDAIVRVHQEWGDRQNRHWARLKYVVYKMGVDWYRNKVREICGGDIFEQPDPFLDYGARLLHHGWIKQQQKGEEDEKDGEFWCFGAFIENGRIIDGPNGKLKQMMKYIAENYPSIEILTTPNQDVLFGKIAAEDKEKFQTDIERFGYGFRNCKPYSKLRMLSGACVGRDTCRLTYTDSEKFEPLLIDELESKWGDLAEAIGVTGCERQCFRPATKTIGWVGSGLNMYSLKIGGTEDARNQGGLLIDPETGEVYLRMVPKKDVATVTDALFEFYLQNRNTLDDKEKSPQQGGMGYFFKRVGAKAIIEWLKKNPSTAKLMEKTSRSQDLPEKKLVNPSLFGC